MRFIIAIFAIFQLVYAKTEQPLEERFQQSLKTTLACYQNYLQLDPIEIGDLEFDLDEKLIRGNFKFFDLKLAGLTTIRIKKLDFVTSPPILFFDITFNLTISGGYDIDSSLINIVPLLGTGDIDLKLGLNFFGDVVLRSKTIEELHFFIATAPNFKISGLLDDEYMSSLISRQAAAIVDEFVNKNIDEISNVISPALMDIINLILWINVKTSESIRGVLKEHVPISSMRVIDKLLEKVGDVDVEILGKMVDLCPTVKELENLLKEAEALNRK